MLKRKIRLLLIFTILATLIISHADAQFWKKKSHRKHHDEQTDTTSVNEQTDSLQTTHKSKKELRREKKKQKKEDKKKKKEEKRELKQQKKHKKPTDNGMGQVTKPEVVNKWADIEYPLSIKKPGYRIDVLAPIYLDELVKGGSVTFKENIPDKAVAGLNFYIGVLMAADSLKQAHFDMDIYVHDIASVSESTDKLISAGLLDSADLIIGAVPSRDVPMLADLAKKRKINFVSVTSPVDGGVAADPFFTMLQPSLKSHCEWIANEIKNMHNNKPALLLFRTTATADNNAFKYLSESGIEENSAKLLCDHLPGKEQIAPYIDSTRDNVVVLAVLDNYYADSVLRVLGRGFPNTHFTIYGMPSWNNLNTLQKVRSYPNMTINVTTPFIVNHDLSAADYVDTVYKTEYGGKPQDMVYKGFETMIWYANMLKRYGTIFNRHYDDNETAPFTKFEIKPRWDVSGNVLFLENKHILLRKYDSKTVNTAQ